MTKNDKSPEIIEKEFNNADNKILYKDVLEDDKTIYNWKCDDCNEIWQTTNYQRRCVEGRGGCSYCTGQKVRKEESLGYLHPELIEEWSVENKKSIFDYSAKNRDVFKWNCKACNQSYEQRIFSRVKGSGCDCLKRKLSEYPILAKEILNADPSKITTESLDIYDWKCNDCNYIWNASVTKRVQGKSKCQKCSKKEVVLGNSLAETHRPLMDDWDFEKNHISPFSITSRNSSIRIHWKCQKFPEYHKWDSKLESRVSKKPTGCPYCSGNKTSVLESIVSDNIKYRNELLAKEFDKEKNTFKIEEIRAGSQEQIWWKCSTEGCDYEWQATPANRTSKYSKTGCKECSMKKNRNGQSNGEIYLRTELKLIFNSIDEVPKTTTHKFSKGQRITVDFYIEELPLAFDLDPYYTHKSKESIARDTEKSKLLKNYCNFFKLRKDPLEKISDEDVVYTCSSNDSKELAKLVYLKILELYPGLDKDTKHKLEKIVNLD